VGNSKGRGRKESVWGVYYLPGASGWTATCAGQPTALWNPQVQAAGPGFGLDADGFGLPITGTANIPIVLEATSALKGGAWGPLHSCTITNGAVFVVDTEWTRYPARFYRIRSP
jgi:hypothetical protein